MSPGALAQWRVMKNRNRIRATSRKGAKGAKLEKFEFRN